VRRPRPFAWLAQFDACLDPICSHASNEVAINWNAPLACLSAALQVLTPAPH
jgi:endoglucanase